MDTGASELEVLDEKECLALLAGSRVGRVGVVVDGQPLIFPVNYVFEGNSVIVRTSVGTMLTGASLGLAAFEVDSFDTERQSGWSVMVQGVGHDVTDAVDLTSEFLQTVEVLPWAPGPKPRLLRIDVRTITGRRFTGRGGRSPQAR
jgi:nitroimidazol reductase NimA-like FMN-containing flavoprotein (pyridoxamine 5'-phosphate oxidase superfamily)